MSDLRRFELLVSAIAGRALDVAPAAPDDPPWTDGSTVFVREDASPRVQLQCLAVQAALIGAGSLDDEVLRAVTRRPALARRYLAIEGQRALAQHEAVLPPAARELVDPLVAARSASPADSLAIASGRGALDEPPPEFGTIRPRQVRSAPASPATAHIPRNMQERALEELDGDGESEAGTTVEFLSSPVGGGGSIGRLLKRLMGDARSAGTGAPGADAPTRVTRGSTRRSASAAVSTVTAPIAFDASGDVAADPHRAVYPEWDVFARRYRPAWCTVIETEVPHHEHAPLPLANGHALQRALARVGTELERRHRQLQGDDIDIDAVVEARVELAAGSAPDEAIYVDSVRARRDLSVLVLLDISGSAGEPSAAAGMTGSTVHDHQRAAAAALTAAFHGLGDRVALYAFRSQGRSSVLAMPVKRFDDAFGTLARQRLGGLAPGAYTRLGAAIRHGAATLERDGGTSRRLLVVLSDGFAYDHGYEGRYGEADARRALAEARRRGTACLCLSIAAGTDNDALRRVFGSAAHAIIPRADQLADVAAPLFRGALRSAYAQRRNWQRRERTRERLTIDSKIAQRTEARTA